MKYRAIRCHDCGKLSTNILGAKVDCECGGENFYGYQIEEKDYTCFRVEKSVAELFDEEAKKENIEAYRDAPKMYEE